jgi:hypothetical protein
MSEFQAIEAKFTYASTKLSLFIAAGREYPGAAY